MAPKLVYIRHGRCENTSYLKILLVMVLFDGIIQLTPQALSYDVVLLKTSHQNLFEGLKIYYFSHFLAN